MEKENSILDKIIQSKQTQDAYRFNPLEVVSHILNNLSFKEREVIKRRFSLDGQEKQTLEEIGKLHNITRERIRQIQGAAIRKIKDLKSIKDQIDGIAGTVKKVLSDFGGIMEESHFLDELLAYSDNNPEDRRATLFIVSQLLEDHIEKIKSSDMLLDGWKLKVLSLDLAHEIIGVLEGLIEKEKKLLRLEDLSAMFKGHEYFEKNNDRINTLLSTTLTDSTLDDEKIFKLLYSYLKISNNINKNILDEWGMSHWSEVTPKRMGDKVYLILKKVKKPMHFTEITKTINDEKFDKKIAYPATIHNELILDDRFVFVCREIYALKEWGYRTGTVSDVIKDILVASGKAITKDQIVDEVLKKRFVKKSTIYLALTNKNLFKKAGNTYTLA